MKIDQTFKGLTARLFVLVIVIVSLPLILEFRLWHEQIQSRQLHQRTISKQSIRRIRIPPIRGRILSSDGQLFTDNIPVYDAYIHIHEMRQPGRNALSKTVSYAFAQIDRTATIIGRKHTITERELKRHLHIYPALPYKAFPNLTKVEHARLIELMPGMPGLEITTRTRRLYPMQDIAAHIIGFVGRKDPSKEIDRDKYSYFLPEYNGRAGLERIFNHVLRGKGGSKLVRVDSMGFFYEEVGQSDLTEAGADLTLTIDSRAQAIAHHLMKGKKGAFVLLDCNSGAVLAIVSSPSYDLNQLSAASYARLANDATNKPLLNRAISGGYSPGSIIKPLIALAMLEHDVFAADSILDCPGYYVVGDTRIKCSNRYGHGHLDLSKALEVSCNPYFIEAGLKLGLEKIRDMYQAIGIGQNPGLEIGTSHSAGTLPDRQMKLRLLNQRWNAFDTALISIGQGMITMSPVQASIFVAALANGGIIYRPYLVEKIENISAGTTVVTKTRHLNKLAISPPTLEVIRQGMHRVIYGSHASAAAARTPLIELAGKTGTAEIGGGRNKRKNTWFICYGPFDSPRYAMAILVEDGDSGGKTAAPIAKQFFESYLPVLRKDQVQSKNSGSRIDPG